MLRFNLLATLFAAALTASAHAQKTWVIDQTIQPGVDFTVIQGAVLLSSPGDTILVKEGTYAQGISVNGKSLTIVGEGKVTVTAPASGNVSGAMIEVRNLSPDQRVFLNGIDVENDSIPKGPGVRIANCAGSVWFENSSVSVESGHAVSIHDSELVYLTGCVFRADRAILTESGEEIGTNGLRISGDSEVQATLISAYGSSKTAFGGPMGIPLQGGSGLHIANSRLHVLNGLFKGGSGTSDYVDGCLTPANGGYGIECVEGDPAEHWVLLHEVETIKGATSAGGSFCNPVVPPPILAFFDPFDLVGSTGGIARTLKSTADPSAGNVSFSMWGNSTDLYWIYASKESFMPLPIPGVDTGLVLDPVQMFPVVQGAKTDYSDSIDLPYSHPSPPVTVVAQALVIDSNLDVYLTNPSFAAFY